MNIFGALFGLADRYQKAQKKRKTRIERKHILENPANGSMPQNYEQEECSLNQEECSLHQEECSLNQEECSLNQEECPLNQEECVLKQVEIVLNQVERVLNQEQNNESREILSEVKELLVKADRILEVYEAVQKSVENQDDSVKDLRRSLEEHCSSIEEKIHTENVKSYRNVQAVLEEMDKRVAKEESLVLMVSSLKTQFKCITWFSVVTLLVLIAYILFSLGVF